MYKVYKAKSWRRTAGGFVPHPRARRYHICYVETIEEARKECARGPANRALAEGKEYRHLSFYEFTGV